MGAQHNVHGLNPTQAMVLSVILNPTGMFSVKDEEGKQRYKSLGRRNLSAYLGVEYNEIANAFDENFIDIIAKSSLSNLHAHRAMVDAALISAASQPNQWGAQDRKTYYEIIGVRGGKTNKDIGSGTKLSREEKALRIAQFFKKVYGKQFGASTFTGRKREAGVSEEETGEAAVPRE